MSHQAPIGRKEDQNWGKYKDMKDGKKDRGDLRMHFTRRGGGRIKMRSLGRWSAGKQKGRKIESSKDRAARGQAGGVWP